MYQIMIVEDDATMAEMMKRQLEAWGHQVHVAEQFQDILGEFTACAPHMVLMDIMLPFFNGYHWCSAIRAISKADILIVGGTSLTVYPAAGLIRYYGGNKLVLINRDETQYDSYANLIFRDPIGSVLSQVV